jgi:hypothetical protein
VLRGMHNIALRRLKQEDHQFESNLGYIAKPFIKKNKGKRKKREKK